MSLKKFEILEMIAKGGMAEVYRARTTGLQGFEKEVCVKKILPHLTEDESFVTMFINEAKLAATLSYANIVQVHDLCVSASGDYFIVMEYVDGKDLSDIIRATQLSGQEIPPAIAVHIIREVCQGLAYAHSRTDKDGAPLNIIHRDVTPHNVLVSYMGEVKLVDFGIAKASSIMSKTAVGILKGKYGYMSPEQARGKPIDHRSDIFNTGIVLYEVLVGERCFAGSSDFSTLNLMRNAEVTAPTEVNAKVPRSLEKIVLKTLAKDVKSRPQTALELEELLGQWAKAEGAVATKADLARFMQGIFKGIDRKVGDFTPGVVEGQSVVGPAPRAPSGSAGSSPPRPPTARAPSLANRPLQSPPPDADPRRQPRELTPANTTPSKAALQQPAGVPEVPSAPFVPQPVARASSVAQPSLRSVIAPPVREAKTEPPAPSAPLQTEPPPAVNEDSAPPQKAPTPGAEAAAPAPAPAGPKVEAPVQAAPAPSPPTKVRKPARIGPQPGANKPKRPVGKQHLRPGLSQVARMKQSPRRTAFTLAAVFVAAGVGGALFGTVRARALSQESAFRAMELAGREAPAPESGLVLIESYPSGLEVWLDGVRLAHPTPVAVERPRSSQALEVKLLQDGRTLHKGEVRFDGKEPVARATFGEAPPAAPSAGAATPQPGTWLSIDAPEGTRVKIDGKRVTASGAAIKVRPNKPHTVELRRKSEKRRMMVTVPEGQTRTLLVEL